MAPPADDEPLLTPLQTALMRVLWARREATVAEVQEGLRATRELALTTVATLLSRLEKRGLVAHRKQGRQFVYRALVSEEEARRTLVAEISERLFDGDLARLVDHLVREHEVRPTDLARIRALIERAEKERGRPRRRRR